MTFDAAIEMENGPGKVIVRVTEEVHISQARRAARAMTDAMGLKRTAAFHLTISVSELASNLWFHALRGGTITLSPIQMDGRVGMEVTAEDHGPGIADVGKALEDGFSTGGGLGGGLPGVMRLMDEFEIQSTLGIGTRIVTRKWQTLR